MSKQKPRHEAFYRLQREKPSDLQNLEKPLGALKAKIEARRKRWNDADFQTDEMRVAMHEVLIELDWMLSEIRKVKTNG